MNRGGTGECQPSAPAARRPIKHNGVRSHHQKDTASRKNLACEYSGSTGEPVIGKLPTTAGWQSPLPRSRISPMQQLRRGVGTLSLVFILFFCTSGGPYTTETLIHEVGPGLGLLILLLIP